MKAQTEAWILCAKIVWISFIPSGVTILSITVFDLSPSKAGCFLQYQLSSVVLIFCIEVSATSFFVIKSVISYKGKN